MFSCVFGQERMVQVGSPVDRESMWRTSWDDWNIQQFMGFDHLNRLYLAGFRPIKTMTLEQQTSSGLHKWAYKIHLFAAWIWLRQWYTTSITSTVVTLGNLATGMNRMEWVPVAKGASPHLTSAWFFALPWLSKAMWWVRNLTVRVCWEQRLQLQTDKQRRVSVWKLRNFTEFTFGSWGGPKLPQGCVVVWRSLHIVLCWVSYECQEKRIPCSARADEASAAKRASDGNEALACRILLHFWTGERLKLLPTNLVRSGGEGPCRIFLEGQIVMHSEASCLNVTMFFCPASTLRGLRSSWAFCPHYEWSWHFEGWIEIEDSGKWWSTLFADRFRLAIFEAGRNT